MTLELTVDESTFTQLVNIEPQYDSLKISNQSDIKVDADALIEHLRLMEGIERVETLTINYNSSLVDLGVLRAFKNVKKLFVYGQHIKSFEGIEWFSKGVYIQIQTHRNRRRDISQLSQTKVKHIDLYVERTEDISAVAGCKYLKTIDIYRSMVEPNLAEWKEIQFERISFKSCKFKELGNIAVVPGLSYINVLGGRSLERFTGDNSNIKRLVVDSCKKLDLSTLKTFEGIEVLIVNSCTKEMNLSEIRGLKYVKHIDFILCNVEVDLINLKEYFPNIESLHISGMKKEYGLQLKQLNPDVQITSRSFEL
ncbi:hypothetical protein [Paenibacillus harenae]|uniref:Leucine-rich repeat domain-containing protein n=1 Tax=Paenibacillus harenae TaxID=306543 RepID=A0ABT9U4R0_PAEHA|nr:hypothetical protein [Paenibacillus harenae]MDQ0062444.1 hypothetical protein [Paenibacillus harenae]MDQ0114630.1 hypothetical protein [Paenibacillus harenae]